MQVAAVDLQGRQTIAAFAANLGTHDAQRIDDPPHRPLALLPRITARCAIDLSPGTLMSPRSGFLIGSIRFILPSLRNLPTNIVGAGKFFFQKRTLAIANPAMEPFQVLDVIAQGTAQR